MVTCYCCEVNENRNHISVGGERKYDINLRSVNSLQYSTLNLTKSMSLWLRVTFLKAYISQARLRVRPPLPRPLSPKFLSVCSSSTFVYNCLGYSSYLDYSSYNKYKYFRTPPPLVSPRNMYGPLKWNYLLVVVSTAQLTQVPGSKWRGENIRHQTLLK